MGRLQVVVCAARKLNDNQVIGIPDPYAKIRMGNTHYKTGVIKNNLNPVWNENFVFQVADDNSAQLVIELWNDNIISDDLMGLYTLSVGNLVRGVVVDNWFVLTQSKTNAELHMRVLAVDFGRLPEAGDQWKVTTDINNDPQQTGAKPGMAGMGGKPGKPGYTEQPNIAGGAPQSYGNTMAMGKIPQEKMGYENVGMPVSAVYLGGGGGGGGGGAGAANTYALQQPGQPQGFGGPQGPHHHHHHHHQHEIFQGGPGFQGGPPQFQGGPGFQGGPPQYYGGAL